MRNNRIVLDTNCLVAALAKHSEFYSVWKDIVSDDKHFEILKSINFPKISVLKLREFIKYL